jgi:hypothetical protein
MLEYVNGRASERKLRLFACACGRRLEHLFPDERALEALAVAERYADGMADWGELRAAFAAAWVDNLVDPSPGDPPPLPDGPFGAVRAAALACADPLRVAKVLDSGANAIFDYIRDVSGDEPYADELQEREGIVYCDLLRDVFGNPFRPVALIPAWLTESVVVLSRSAYEERRLPVGTLDRARLAVLADALEEAGCTDAQLLGHLRGPGPHVRGCWPVDLVLAKE